MDRTKKIIKGSHHYEVQHKIPPDLPLQREELPLFEKEGRGEILLKMSALFLRLLINDGLVKSPIGPFFVIPAKAGIQLFQWVVDSGFHRSDDS
jgi:hypothetical protein